MKVIGELHRDTRPELAEIACPNCSLRYNCRECELYEFSLLAAIIGDDSQQRVVGPSESRDK
jgi:hypothetical protein